MRSQPAHEAYNLTAVLQLIVLENAGPDGFLQEALYPLLLADPALAN
jgi:hypothetical protein